MSATNVYIVVKYKDGVSIVGVYKSRSKAIKMRDKLNEKCKGYNYYVLESLLT